MKYSRLVICAVLLIAGALWFAGVFEPGPKVLINRQLKKLSSLASFAPNEPGFHRFAKIEQMGALFTEDVMIHLDSPETENRELHGRDEVMQYAMAAKSVGNGLKAEFLDVNIDMGPGKQTALVDLTLKAQFANDTDFIPLELQFTMKRIKGEWLISRVESVKTLKP